MSPKKMKKEKESEKKRKGKQDVEYDDTADDFLGNVIIKAKKKMDDVDKFNGTTYLLIGGSGSGKSTLLKEVFFNHIFLPKITPTKKDYIVVMFTKSELSDAIKGIHEQVIIAPELDEDIIRWAVNMVTTYGKEKYNFVFVMDDCIHIRNLKIVENCFLTFRNLGITTILSLQYAKNIPPGIRGTVYFACLMHAGKSSAEVAIETFVSDFLPGKNLSQRTRQYVTQTKGYKFYFVDGLNHEVYFVDEHYKCTKMDLVSEDQMVGGSINTRQEALEGFDPPPQASQNSGTEE